MIILTDAEWQVMRVIWEKQPVAATVIAQSLIDTQAWSISTVKTLLSRLVDKHLIEAQPDGKKFLYRPIWTERDCVVSEMRQVLHRIYGGDLRFQTKRFSFFGSPSVCDVESLSSFLESQTDRIEKRYSFHTTEKQEIILYGSKNRMHSALGLANAPEWLRAAWVWDIIHLAPENTFDEIEFQAAALFVWMQKVLSLVNPAAPYWLSQGIAALESGIIKPSRVKKVIVDELPTLQADSVIQLSSNYDAFRFQNGYELTITVIEYMIHQFGWDKLVDYLKQPSDFETIFHQSEVTFWNQWLKHVHTFYGRKESTL